MLALNTRIALLAQLGQRLLQDSPQRQAATQLAQQHNGWFSIPNSLFMLESIARDWLNQPALEQWLSAYPALQQNNPQKRIGLILAGNIPAVGLHDVLSVFAAGHIALLKYSDKDKFLIPYVLQELAELNPETKAYFEVVERIQQPDAIIATGSDSSGIYFKQYFGKYPHIIRQSRQSAAVLDGTESEEALHRLGRDIFQFFGLGCRSVSKLYVPENYDFMPLMKALDEYKEVMNHTKYVNNFDYNRSLFLINNIPHLINDCILITPNEALASRIGTLHYEFYKDISALTAKLSEGLNHKIQCVASDMNLSPLPTVKLGATQCPLLSDYADGVDTMAFLLDC